MHKYRSERLIPVESKHDICYTKSKYIVGGDYVFRIAICDDILDSLQQAKNLIGIWQEKPEDLYVETFTDADALIAAHSKLPFDIILLDIMMPLLNGIDAAKEIRQQDGYVKIVFLTSSPEFAVESYAVKANNYLLKPVVPEALYNCLNELVQEIRLNAKSVLIKGGNTVHRVPLNLIEYVEANNKEVLFSLVNGQSFISKEPLYTYEDQFSLADGFYKCNRSYIVNLYQIDTYTATEVTTRSGCRIRISRRIRKDFESIYFSLLFGKAGEM